MQSGFTSEQTSSMPGRSHVSSCALSGLQYLLMAGPITLADSVELVVVAEAGQLLAIDDAGESILQREKVPSCLSSSSATCRNQIWTGHVPTKVPIHVASMIHRGEWREAEMKATSQTGKITYMSSRNAANSGPCLCVPRPNISRPRNEGDLIRPSSFTTNASSTQGLRRITNPLTSHNTRTKPRARALGPGARSCFVAMNAPARHIVSKGIISFFR